MRLQQFNRIAGEFFRLRHEIEADRKRRKDAMRDGTFRAKSPHEILVQWAAGDTTETDQRRARWEEARKRGVIVPEHQIGKGKTSPRNLSAGARYLKRLLVAELRKDVTNDRT